MSSTTSRLIFSSGWDSRKISQPGKYISSRKLFFICLCIPFSMWRYFGEEKEWNLYRGIEPLLKNGTHIEKYLESLLRNGTHIEEWNRYCGMEHIQRNGTVIEEWNRYWGMEPLLRNGTYSEEWNLFRGMEPVLRNGTHTEEGNSTWGMEPIRKNGTHMERWNPYGGMEPSYWELEPMRRNENEGIDTSHKVLVSWQERNCMEVRLLIQKERTLTVCKGMNEE